MKVKNMPDAADTSLGDELIASLREGMAILRGDQTPAREFLLAKPRACTNSPHIDLRRRPLRGCCCSSLRHARTSLTRFSQLLHHKLLDAARDQTVPVSRMSSDV
jgi:hypothetical protein